jgi:hypothetical protein
VRGLSSAAISCAQRAPLSERQAVMRVARKRGNRHSRRCRPPRRGGGSSARHRVGSSACLRARCHCRRPVSNNLALRSAAMPAERGTHAAPRQGRDDKASRAGCCFFRAVSPSIRRRAADSCHTIAQGGDRRPVAQIAQGRPRNRGEQFTPFGAPSSGVLPVLTTCPGPAPQPPG